MKLRTRTLGGPTAGFVLSVAFSLALLAIQSAELALESWLPEEGQPAPITLRLPAYSVFRVHLGQPAELVRTQVIIGRGEVVEPTEEARLAAAYESVRRGSQVGWSLGMFLVTLVAALLLLAEMRRAPGASRLLRTQATMLSLVLAFAAGGKAFLLLTSLPTFYYPMPALVLVAAYVLGRRIALAVNLFSSVLFASLLGFDLAAMVVIFTTSYAATLLVRDRKRRRTVVFAGAMSGWSGALALLVLMLVFSGAINVHRDLLNPDYSAVLAAVVCGVVSGAAALGLVDLVGWLVGRVSPGKLVELQDLDHPILKQLRDDAPGTWEHSRAAANLAEAAAAAIGADSLLVRVGAYVHDAGKALNPEYFIENQSALEAPNPHDELAPEVSADCIFDHVREGAALLRKHHVPEAVVEFAYTHHGTGVLEYFWVKAMKAGNPKDLSEKTFRYPGMRPRTRETGILMLVDAVEAASRTIKDPSKQKLESLVQRIVFSKLAQGQLDECGLTASDLKSITTTLVESLVNMYHARIEYPWQQTTTQTGPQPATTTTGPLALAVEPSPTGDSPPRSTDRSDEGRATPDSGLPAAADGVTAPPAAPLAPLSLAPHASPPPRAEPPSHAPAGERPPPQAALPATGFFPTDPVPTVNAPPPPIDPTRFKTRRRSAITLSGVPAAPREASAGDGSPAQPTLLGLGGAPPRQGSAPAAAVETSPDDGSGTDG
jgi:hypothetical protein